MPRRIAFALCTLLAAGCATPKMGMAFKDLEYPRPVSHVDVDGIEMAYTDVGQGPRALVLIHGLGSYSPVWTRNLDALAGAGRVIALDLPGYGKSQKANYRYSMEFFARAVDRLIERLGLTDVVLVGHSMGSQIAMTHALLFPGKAKALVLAAPAGFERFKPGEGRWLAEAVSKLAVKFTPPEAIYSNLAANFQDMPKEAGFMAEDRIRVIGGADFDAYAYANSRSVAAMINGPVADRLPQIAVPVLVVFGEGDRLIPNPILHGGSTRQVAESGVSRLPKGKLVMIPGAGHMLQFEKPEAFNQAVLEFLRGL
ncbi:MAG TPA: alpha/beta hydrolase [Myxococcaceae bacterium]|nr:alpha/beta hydrolase [Myxococcaceae bacterium]